ncbi:hypothetical protein KKC67_03230 [Patescibacteria group bacterium]|nr:hypothetical protein [Patescibacteria group bacterium]MBU0879625.1 hypothetical protein [Patescibacteria group bacterium]MBU0880486.1 hypothetical protein [Patescibacteria group bacterium]MBU0897929.1 hypothetical protein [Patescibacteria group bacterium]MBU1783308.1 hypothetical protein [Patescibacteria group bacterium]
MKLFLNKSQLTMNPAQLLRCAGYACIRDRRTGQESMVHRLGGGFYPRFHLYLEDRGEQVILNLHLDQKQPRYEGITAHNADYDGEVVEREIERIKSFAINNARPKINNSQFVADGNEKNIDNIDLLDKIRPKQFSAPDKKVEKKSWWRKIIS